MHHIMDEAAAFKKGKLLKKLPPSAGKLNPRRW